jgi:hypothetical protein
VLLTHRLATINGTPVANLPPVSTAPAVPVAKFAAGMVDTDELLGKF